MFKSSNSQYFIVIRSKIYNISIQNSYSIAKNEKVKQESVNVKYLVQTTFAGSKSIVVDVRIHR